MTEPLRLSYSAISDFQRCPRYFAYRRIMGARPVGAGDRPLAFGTAFHAGQQVWWAGRSDDDPAVRLQAARVAFAEAARELRLEDQILGDILLTGYAARWADQGYMFHAEPIVEEKVIVPVLGPHGPDPDLEVTAVFDVVAYDEHGTTAVVEHKTTRSALDDGSKYWARTDPNLQVSLYYIVAHDAGRSVGRFVWDAVRAPEYRMHQATPPEHREFRKRDDRWGRKGDPLPGTRLAAETPDEFANRVQDLVLSDPGAFYARRDLVRTPDALDRARADLWAVGRAMLHARDADLYPRSPQACDMFGAQNRCEFAPVCWGGESIENPRLYTLRARDPFEK